MERLLHNLAANSQFDPPTFTSGHIVEQHRLVRSAGVYRPTILIVDDDPGVCETFCRTFTREGVDVRTANSGGEGLAMASTGAFDLWLIDFLLPDMLGTEFIRRLNQTCPAPFVLVSGFLRTETTVEAMKLGASTVLEKPVTIEILRDVVLPLLGDRRVRRGVGKSRPTTADSGRESSRPPRSAAERWAIHVIKACESDRDLTTVGE